MGYFENFLKMLVILTKPAECVEVRTSRAGLRIEDLEPERNGGAFHGNPPLLFVLPAIEIPDFPGHPGGDDIVRSQQGVHKGRLPVVYMTNRGHVPDQGSVSRLFRCGRHRFSVMGLGEGGK